MIPAGDLRHRITIQSNTGTRDSMGGITDSWTDVTTVWADIQPMRTSEMFQHQQTGSLLTHNVRIRTNRTITSAMRVKFTQAGVTRYFIIEGKRAIGEIPLGEEILQCREVDEGART